MFGRFTSDDKMMLGLAMQEATDLEHNHLGNDHLILGMLCLSLIHISEPTRPY